MYCESKRKWIYRYKLILRPLYNAWLSHAGPCLRAAEVLHPKPYALFPLPFLRPNVSLSRAAAGVPAGGGHHEADEAPERGPLYGRLHPAAQPVHRDPVRRAGVALRPPPQVQLKAYARCLVAGAGGGGNCPGVGM